jgi:8-oxo-dGTP pyrophosphatase MutT (NUDIX family)
MANAKHESRKNMSTQLNSQITLHEGRVFRLVRENVTLENGVVAELDVIRHPGAAAIVPFLNEKTLLLIKQYRHAAGGFIWEIPAGTIDSDESPLACAKRELIEETGFSAENWEKIGEITPLPAYSDERIHIFSATNLTAKKQHLDQDEILDVHEVSFDDALLMIGNHQIQDAKTISGLFMANLKMKDV